MKLPSLAAVAAAGGSLGAGLRMGLIEFGPPGNGYQAALLVTLAINVVGCALLAALPAAAFVRRSHPWSVFLGTGVLGGFTTMSTAVALPMATLSESSAFGYLALTLGTALLAVWVVRRFVPRATTDARLVDDS